jgi:hypothetical protein
MQSFKVGAPDAEFLEKEYTPLLSAGDIVGIANYKAYIKLNIDNSTTRVFSMSSIYTQDYQNLKIVPILKEYSAKKYGRKREFVDAEIEARLGMSANTENLPDPNAIPPGQATAQINVAQATTPQEVPINTEIQQLSINPPSLNPQQTQDPTIVK